MVPHSSGGRLLELAGKESLLRNKHGIYLDVVTIATAPVDYLARVTPLYPGVWKNLHLFVLEAHDLALTKLERNFERAVTLALHSGNQSPARLLEPSTRCRSPPSTALRTKSTTTSTSSPLHLASPATCNMSANLVCIAAQLSCVARRDRREI